jgi:ABC-type bacteriocin/lantibiotic exporter with double-glycine peptidase domain
VLPYIRRQFRQLSELRLVIAACAVLQLLALAPAALTAYVFGTLLPQGSAGALWPLALGALALAALQPLVELARNYLVLHVRSIVNVRMTSDLVEQLFGIPLKAFQERSYGDVMNRIQAAEQVRQAVTGAGLGMLLDALLSACGWLVLIAVSPAAAAATAALCAIAWVVLGALYRRLNARLALLFASHSRGQGFLMQLLMGMETLRAGGMAAAAKSRW